jgi:Rad3-related DNA helicase
MSISQEALDHIESLIDEECPFPSYLPGQRNIISRCVHAYVEGKEYVVLEAGTGTGKSGIGYVIGKVVSQLINEEQLNKIGELGGTSGTIITKTRVLQKQYDDTMPPGSVGVLWGKAHYSDVPEDHDGKVCKCANSCPGMTYDHSPIDCPYLLAFRAYLSRDTVGVTNNAMYLAAPIFRDDTSCLVVDEAHKFPDSLVDAASLELCSYRLLKMMEEYQLEGTGYMVSCVEYERGFGDGRIPVKKLHTHLTNLHGFLEAQVGPELDQAKAAAMSVLTGDTASGMKIAKKFDRARSFIDNVAKAIKTILRSSGIDNPQDMWIAFRDEGGEKVIEGTDVKIPVIEIKPLNPPVTILDTVRTPFSVYMSATIDYEQFIEDMRLDKDAGTYVVFESPFPVENRKVMDLGLAGMNYSNREELLGKNGIFASALIKFANKHAGERGLIHSVSYSNARLINELLYRAGFNVHTPKSGVVIDRAYVEALGKDVIIISPAMMEGVDLKDDLCRWQVILKVPYPSMGSSWVKAKMQYSDTWYNSQAQLDIMQMCGRPVRHMTDYATTYVLDSNFRRLSWPDWFKKTIIST